MSPSAINTGIGLCAPFLHPISNREMIQGSKIVYHIHQLRNRLNEFSLQRRISSLLCVHLSYNAGYGCYLPHGHSSHLSFQRASFRPIYIASEGAIRPSGTAPPPCLIQLFGQRKLFSILLEILLLSASPTTYHPKATRPFFSLDAETHGIFCTLLRQIMAFVSIGLIFGNPVVLTQF